MTKFTFFGTTKSEYISTLDIAEQNPGRNLIEIYADSGDDTISALTNQEVNSVLAYGQEGDDFLGASCYDADAVVFFDGGRDTDTFYWSGGLIDSDPVFSRFERNTNIIRFSLTDSFGNNLEALIAPTVEVLSFTDTLGKSRDYLVEDIFKGRTRAVDFDEVYYRAYGDNADWYVNDLDTLTSYYDSFPPLTLNAFTAQLLYVAYYGRPADSSGLVFWQQKISESGFSYAPRLGDALAAAETPLYNRIVVDFGNSEESRSLYSGKSAKQCADAVYNYCFGRNAEIDRVTGQNYWVAKLENKEITLSQLAAEVALGAQGQDLVFLTNKVASANQFFNAMDTDQEKLAYAGDAAGLLARNWLSLFGPTSASAFQADIAMASLVSA